MITRLRGAMIDDFNRDVGMGSQESQTRPSCFGYLSKTVE